MKFLIKKNAAMSSDLVFAMHAYIPAQTVTLAKDYRNLVNMVNVITTKLYVY